MTEKQKKIFTTNILHQTTFVPQFALESEENCVTETPKSRASFCRRKHQPCWILISSLPAFPRRSLRCVHGREHHGPGGDRGGDDAHPAPARGSGAQRVRAALHVSCRTVCVRLVVTTRVIELDKMSQQPPPPRWSW